MNSRHYVDTRTGEVVTRVPVSQIRHFKEHAGPVCFFAPASRAVLDVLNEKTGRTLYGEKTPEQLRDENPDVIMLTLDEALDRHQSPFISPVQEVTESDFMEALEVLPPEDWQHDSLGQSFKMCERTCAEVTAIYAAVAGRFFFMSDKYTTPHVEIIRRCRAFMSGEGAHNV